MKHHCLLFTFLISVFFCWTQDYRQMITEGTYTVAEIQAVAETYFAQVGTERGKGFKPYKRWEYQALRNMDENGMLKSPEFYYNELENYNNYLNDNFSKARTTVGAWEEMGPRSWAATGGWNPGVGRITSIAVEEANPMHIIVGGPTGGVWKSTDGGSTWTVLTDDLSNIEVYALAIDPIVNTTYYWGSSGGIIFKSTDSGATWNILANTGFGRVNKILINPTNTNKMYFTSEGGGIFKTSDSGNTWTNINSSELRGFDIEFKPDGLYSTIYASGRNVFMKSTDSGETFSEISGFLTFSPKMIGVSADDPDVVYILETGFLLRTFGGFYRSDDSGNTFTKLDHTNKNYFGRSSLADDDIGQAPRDMDIAVNPNNVNDVHIAGINTWRSTDGGENFSITSQWNPSNANTENIGYCHADIDLLMFVNNKLYIGTDGGIFVADNPTVVDSNYYRDLTSGLGIRQFYKIGVSQTDPVVVTGGSQDNGSSIMGTNTVGETSDHWIDWLGADGMEGFIGKNSNSTIFGTSQNGKLYKSYNSGLSRAHINTPGSGAWVTPFEQDPLISGTIYAGYNQVYKSTDEGFSWTTVSQDFGDSLDHLKIAQTNSNFQYAAKGSSLYKNDSVGQVTNWTELSGFSGSINSIAIHPSDPNKVAIATTGDQKVYVSTNGGTSWVSYKFNLPNFSAQALVWDDNGEDGLYLGMNYGVYYIDNTFTEWQPFSNGLPNVIISELEINTADSKIYAATYGRGLWRSDVFATTALGVNNLEFDNISIYPNPATKKITLKWDRGDRVSIRIYDSLGKLMFFSKNNSLTEPKDIDISNYASGLYFVKINNINGVVTKKLTVK